MTGAATEGIVVLRYLQRTGLGREDTIQLSLHNLDNDARNVCLTPPNLYDRIQEYEGVTELLLRENDAERSRR